MGARTISVRAVQLLIGEPVEGGRHEVATGVLASVEQCQHGQSGIAAPEAVFGASELFPMALWRADRLLVVKTNILRRSRGQNRKGRRVSVPAFSLSPLPDPPFLALASTHQLLFALLRERRPQLRPHREKRG